MRCSAERLLGRSDVQGLVDAVRGPLGGVGGGDLDDEVLALRGIALGVEGDGGGDAVEVLQGADGLAARRRGPGSLPPLALAAFSMAFSRMAAQS